MKQNSRLILLLSSLIIFLFILIAVVIKTPNIDYFISENIKTLWGSFNEFFIFIGNYSKEILAFIALVSVGVLYIQKRKEASFILFISLLTGYILEKIISFTTHRTRPVIQLVEKTDYSFPSGHSIFSIILFSLIIYFYKNEIKNKQLKFVFIFANILLIFLVGFSRIYINVHWFTDVVGGYVLGLFVINLILFIMEFISKDKNIFLSR